MLADYRDKLLENSVYALKYILGAHASAGVGHSEAQQQYRHPALGMKRFVHAFYLRFTKIFQEAEWNKAVVGIIQPLKACGLIDNVVRQRLYGSGKILYLISGAYIDRSAVFAACNPVHGSFQLPDCAGGYVLDDHENHHEHESTACQEQVYQQADSVHCLGKTADAHSNNKECFLRADWKLQSAHKEHLLPLDPTSHNELVVAVSPLRHGSKIHSVGKAVGGHSGRIQLVGGDKLQSAIVHLRKVNLRLLGIPGVRL